MAERIKIIAKPNSQKSEVAGYGENAYIVRVKAPAAGNKANVELVKFLSKEWKCRVRIVSGFNSREKVVERT